MTKDLDRINTWHGNVGFVQMDDSHDSLCMCLEPNVDNWIANRLNMLSDIEKVLVETFGNDYDLVELYKILEFIKNNPKITKPMIQKYEKPNDGRSRFKRLMDRFITYNPSGE